MRDLCCGVLQVVVDRMFKRVLTFAGAPVALGMLLFPVFWYLKVGQPQHSTAQHGMNRHHAV